MRAAAGMTYGIALGAGLMYLMDPRQGGARRARIRDKSLRAVHEVEHAAIIGSRDLEHRGEGLLAAIRGPRREVSGDVIVERVRAALGRHCSHPHAISVKATDGGLVELEGPILSADVPDVLHAIAHVPGVAEIDDDLEIHDAPDRVPGLQGPPNHRTRRIRITPATKLIAGLALASTATASLVRGNPLVFAAGGAGILALAR